MSVSCPPPSFPQSVYWMCVNLKPKRWQSHKIERFWRSESYHVEENPAINLFYYVSKIYIFIVCSCWGLWVESLLQQWAIITCNIFLLLTLWWRCRRTILTLCPKHILLNSIKENKIWTKTSWITQVKWPQNHSALMQIRNISLCKL